MLDWTEQLEAELVGVADDVTRYRVGVDYTEPVVYDVSARNGDGGSLSSTIQIHIERERKSISAEYVTYPPGFETEASGFQVHRSTD